MVLLPARAVELTEKQWLQQVLDVAKLYRWAHYHPWLSVHSQTGWPDLALVKPPRLVLAELKAKKGVLTDNQRHWLGLLTQCSGVEVYLWRAPDLEPVRQILSGGFGESWVAQSELRFDPGAP